ncbi:MULTISPECIES: ABC transporter substrate-binding protein/permease [Vagococcus]|uniref:Amino acid ABC transporter, amino acid-binding/permease protein n=1 Tax=Vagococcus fluvialis bH819 TaxID=1255619 RepID=A0A1X8XKV6_9ENTE|nr:MULTISPECIES: ABC transporter substrate-binding protein/permease [Vagococcus]SLM84478.1 Amino acid ABC transporter, amino acid-binding/permease protein [Vagococcus fluvialis bH819]HCM90517.1 ABC transporter permease [Vagococcus sp.]
MIKKWQKKLVIIIMFLISLISLSSVHAENTDPTLKKVQDKGVLTVGLSADYAPYEFHATVDGKDKIVGTDIDIAQKIADDMGVKLKVEEYGFDALIGALKTGKIDMIISGMSPTPERLKEVDFSESYMTVDQKVVIRKDDKDKFNSINSFEGLKVGAQKQSTQEELSNDELHADTVSLQRLPDIILQLQNKKIDGAVIEGPVAEAYVAQSDLFAIASDLSFKNGTKETAVAIPKNSTDFADSVNKSIRDIKDQKLMDGYKEEAYKLMFNEESFFKKYGSFYLKGTAYTVFLAFVGVLFGAVIGAILALMKLSKNKLLKIIAVVYIEYVRGTPLLVQIFLVFFGSNVIGLDLSALAASCLALSLNSGAYVAEIIRAGINAVDNGQTEAARSLGMNQFQAMKHIVFPQAIKNILPALGNEFVTVIKESSVVSVIGVSELMFQGGVVQGASFKPFLPIVIVSMIYFVLTFTLSRILGVAERRMASND